MYAQAIEKTETSKNGYQGIKNCHTKVSCQNFLRQYKLCVKLFLYNVNLQLLSGKYNALICMSNSYYNKYATAISERSDKYNIEKIVNYNMAI